MISPIDGNRLSRIFSQSLRGIVFASCLALSTTTALIAAASAAHAQIGFNSSFGSLGSGLGQFHTPTGIAIDRGYYVYVADSANGRVEKGHFSGYLTITWDTSITDTHLATPVAVATDAIGNVYVVDSTNNWVVEFDSTGAFVRTIATVGTGVSTLSSPAGAAVDSAGNIYVADTGNRRVVEFDGATGLSTAVLTTSLGVPFGITTDAADNVWVTDTVYQRADEYSSGALSSSFVVGANPFGIAVDPSGRVIVTSGNAVNVFDTTGTALGSFSFAGGDYFGGFGVASAGNSLLIAFETSNNIASLLIGPHVTGVSPSTSQVGDPDTPIVIHGLNFDPTSTATISGTPLTGINYVNATTLDATIPYSALTAVGTAAIKVTTPGALGSSSSTSYTIHAVKPPKPTGTISPTNGPVGIDAHIIIVGTGFYSGTTLSFGTTPLTITSLSPTVITATIPGAYLTTPGNYLLNLTNPGGGMTPMHFAVDNPLPSVDTISPSQVLEESSDTQITITGSSFVPGCIARLNKQKLMTSFTDSGDLTAIIPHAMLTVGSYPITVLNPGPGGGVSPQIVTFTVTPFILNANNFFIIGNPTVIRSGNRLGVSAVIYNDGNYAARNFFVSIGLLNGVMDESISPSTQITLSPGGTHTYTFVFPASAAAAGTTPTLTLGCIGSNVNGEGTAVRLSAPCETVP